MEGSAGAARDSPAGGRGPHLGLFNKVPSMDLLEYQGKQLFDRHGVPVPDGRLAVSVEEALIAAEDAEAIARLHVDPLLGFQDFHGRRLAFEARVDADVVRPVGEMLRKLYDVFVSEEATLVEVNPLIITPDQGGGRGVRALDA